MAKLGAKLNAVEDTVAGTGSTLVIRPETGVPNQRHRFAALMLASGFKTSQIAKRLGCSPQTIRTFKRSPLFNVLVREYSRRLLERGLDTAAANLLADATQNVEFLKKVRDGEWDDDVDKMNVRLRAGGMLFEKQFPKQTDVSTQQRVEQALRTIADRAVEEVDEIDVPAVPTLDETIAAHEEEEVM